MATLVGHQKDFADALYELCELDYDAIKAYDAAIEHIEKVEYKEQLRQFRADHQRHVEEISALLQQHNKKVPTEADAKSILTQGKVFSAKIFGDKALLKAMLSNEVDTNTAYENINEHEDLWPDAKDIVVRGLEDEKRHKAWLEIELK